MYWVLDCLGFFSSPSLLVVGMSIPDLLVLHSSLPRYSSLQVQLNRLVYNWCLRKGKTGWELEQNWCWDFTVSSEVYELLFSRIWLLQMTCCGAGWERTEVLPLPGSSVGENEQESSMKAVPIEEKTRTEKRKRWKVSPKKSVLSSVNLTAKKCCFPEFSLQEALALGQV